MRLIVALFASALLAAPAQSQGSGPYQVEGGGRYASLQRAVDAIGGGTGTIRIAPGRYRDCAVQEQGRITFVAEPGKVTFDGGICEGKATLVLRGQGARVDGIVFTRTFVPDGNGAGIRIETGDLDVANSMFVDGQCGILSADDPASAIRVDKSTFARLGKHPDGSGAHALYIGGYGSLRVTRSRFEQGTGGHYLKSRAPRIEIVDNSFDDSRGHTTNYMIDLPNGASGRIADNSFVQGADKENYSTLITVAPEGIEHTSRGLVIENNRASLAPAFRHETTFVGDWAKDGVTVRGNMLAPRITAYARR
ncbi:right-handed parallel beta-helix repeat-containing protein [Sphingomonas sp.]|uniref:right-handed parallel beta-helix repeat-containing protein n=1 Tax=Sphingomonas sp. TaxID=28214 RepID=UPI002B628BB7|nr:right-handed parallel beta-helix repeat-containing protein [Sphingomonas sp.]HTG38228.1 right-handed parallel beta-helix repeat-containing protein [Sphingomonas sp.]